MKVWVVYHATSDNQFVHDIFDSIDKALDCANGMNNAVKIVDGMEGHAFTVADFEVK